jgi:hypothetical protein
MALTIHGFAALTDEWETCAIASPMTTKRKDPPVKRSAFRRRRTHKAQRVSPF